MHLQRPPQVDQETGGMGFLGLIPLLGAAGSMTVMMLFRGSPFAAVGALMMILTVTGAVVMLFSQRGKTTRQRRSLRDSYLDYLENCRVDFLEEERVHRRRAQSCDPLPGALPDIIRDPRRLWERRRNHEDFLSLRIGTGRVECRKLQLDGSQDPTQRPDPHLEHELQGVVSRFATAPDMPLLVPLAQHHTVSIVGDQEFGAQVIRHLMVSGAALHSPEDLHLAAAIPADQHDSWAWITWLPHFLNQGHPTSHGPLQRIASTPDELRTLLDGEIQQRYQRHAELRKNHVRGTSPQAQPRLLAFHLDGEGASHNMDLPNPAVTTHDLGITEIHLTDEQRHEPERVSLRISQTPAGVRIEDYTEDFLDPNVSTGLLADCPHATAAGLARMLAPRRLSPDSLEHNAEAEGQRFTAQLGLHDFTPREVERLWENRAAPDFLRAPIGIDERGMPVSLDLKESAQHGMGPHGLCVGATGSGKSELLRTLVLGLAITHAPEMLNMVLVDYKGGATFAPFDPLPHVAGIITNLSDDPTLVDRIYASLEGEVIRRQKVLKAAGNIANITDYQAYRAQRLAAGIEIPALPHLVVVIDEFGELLTAQPDFIDLFMSIGRIGRSIGVHLLLSSQRIESGKLRGLDTYLSYRLGLRTLSEGESRTVLETPDAFHLPPSPGYGYLKVDTTTYTRFKAGYVSGPLSVETADSVEVGVADDDLPVVPGTFYAEEALRRERETAAQDRRETPAETAPSTTAAGPSVLETLVDALAAHPRVTNQLWLPPLPPAVTLDQATETGNPNEVVAEESRRRRQPLLFPIGVLDDPARQWQGAWNLDLTRAGGNAALIGGPSSGKSTALRTIALSLATTHSPHEVALFGIDLRGSGLQPLDGLPHSAGMASRTSKEAVRRTVEEVIDILEEREKLFERRGIDSLSTFRQLHADGELEELDAADVVLFVDGWGALVNEFEELQDHLFNILSRGGGYGLHVIATATRWNEIRLAQQAFFGTRLEMRLADPTESSHGRKQGERIPPDRPGRGLNHDRLIGQISLPRMDGITDLASMNSGLQTAVEYLQEVNPRRVSRRVRLLPAEVGLEDLPPAPRTGSIPLGLSERDLSAKFFETQGQERHLLVLGDELSGKSSILRHIMLTLAAQFTAEEIVFAVVDPRRSLQNVLPDEYIGAYATNVLNADSLAASVTTELQARAENTSPTQSAPTSFTGPLVVLIVDDYDVITAGGASPLAPFNKYLAMSPEIGFHAFVTRPVRGASRGIYESFVSSLRDAGSGTLIMDGDRSEGALVNGVRARRQPPGRGLYLHGGRSPLTVQVVLRGLNSPN